MAAVLIAASVVSGTVGACLYSIPFGLLVLSGLLLIIGILLGGS